MRHVEAVVTGSSLHAHSREWVRQGRKEARQKQGMRVTSCKAGVAWKWYAGLERGIPLDGCLTADATMRARVYNDKTLWI